MSSDENNGKVVEMDKNRRRTYSYHFEEIPTITFDECVLWPWIRNWLQSESSFGSSSSH